MAHLWTIEDADREFERLFKMTDEEVLAAATPEDLAAVERMRENFKKLKKERRK